MALQNEVPQLNGLRVQREICRVQLLLGQAIVQQGTKFVRQHGNQQARRQQHLRGAVVAERRDVGQPKDESKEGAKEQRDSNLLLNARQRVLPKSRGDQR